MMLCGIQCSVIMANFLMLATQQSIIIIYFSYFLEYILRTVSFSFLVGYKQFSCAGL